MRMHCTSHRRKRRAAMPLPITGLLQTGIWMLKPAYQSRCSLQSNEFRTNRPPIGRITRILADPIRSIRGPFTSQTQVSTIASSLRDRDCENPSTSHQRANLLEPCLAHEVVKLALRASPHHPRIAFSISQHARDHLDLRMPRLTGVDEISAFFYGAPDPFYAPAHRSVFREQLEESRDDRDIRTRCDPRVRGLVERISLLELDSFSSKPTRQHSACLDICIGVATKHG